jgi:hypothetical protein
MTHELRVTQAASTLVDRRKVHERLSRQFDSLAADIYCEGTG